MLLLLMTLILIWAVLSLGVFTRAISEYCDRERMNKEYRAKREKEKNK